MLVSNLGRLKFEGHTARINAIAAEPNGRWIVSGCRATERSHDETIRMWDISNGKCLHVLNWHYSSMNALTVNPDGKLIVSTNDDKVLCLWEARTGTEAVRMTFESPVIACAINLAGTYLVVADYNGEIHILTLENYELGPAFVTAWYSRAGEDHAFDYPYCLNWSGVRDSALTEEDRLGLRSHQFTLGAEVQCPHCQKAVRLDQFTIQANWRPIAEAWRATKRHSWMFEGSGESTAGGI